MLPLNLQMLYLLFVIPGASNGVTGQKRNLMALMKLWYNQLSLSALKLMQTNKAIGGFHLGYLYDYELINRTMAELLALYRQGKIKPRIDSCHHFEEVSSVTLRVNLTRGIDTRSIVWLSTSRSHCNCTDVCGVGDLLLTSIGLTFWEIH